MRKFLNIIVYVLALAGCAGMPGGAVNSVEAQRTVFAGREAYILVLKKAGEYEDKPRCSATVVTACSDPAVVAQIRKADDVAKLAIDAATAAVRTPQISTAASNSAVQTANSALAALSALIAGVLK